MPVAQQKGSLELLIMHNSHYSVSVSCPCSVLFSRAPLIFGALISSISLNIGRDQTKLLEILRLDTASTERNTDMRFLRSWKITG